MNTIWFWLQRNAKAVAAGPLAGAAFLSGVISQTETDWLTAFGDVSVSQWLILATVVGGVYGVTWKIPNRP